MKHFCILFAGAAGSSKTPVAYYLGQNLGWPVFNNDAIRAEVKEDIGRFDADEYKQRQQRRFAELLSRQVSFIFDASVDRSWPKTQQNLEAADYQWFLISFDLSEGLLDRLYNFKKYDTSLVGQYYAEHNEFLRQYQQDVHLHIGDDEFSQRLAMTLQETRKWLDDIGAKGTPT